VAAGTAEGGGKWWRCSRALAELEEGDDTWGPLVSWAWRGAKVVEVRRFPIKEAASG
jgi:hypothetical protein